ncbi:MAG: hypothetical protein ACXW27_04230 [Allosphingosinicella sp.]
MQHRNLHDVADRRRLEDKPKGLSGSAVIAMGDALRVAEVHVPFSGRRVGLRRRPVGGRKHEREEKGNRPEQHRLSF